MAGGTMYAEHYFQSDNNTLAPVFWLVGSTQLPLLICIKLNWTCRFRFSPEVTITHTHILFNYFLYNNIVLWLGNNQFKLEWMLYNHTSYTELQYGNLQYVAARWRYLLASRARQLRDFVKKNAKVILKLKHGCRTLSCLGSLRNKWFIWYKLYIRS